jgi:excisionase family DNA binding protein
MLGLSKTSPERYTNQRGGKVTVKEQLSVGLEAAGHMVGLSQTTLRRMIRRGELRAARAGRRILIPVSQLRRLARPGATTGTGRTVETPGTASDEKKG